MTIHNKKGFDEAPAAGFDGVFDWDFLDVAWYQEGKPEGKQIKPMDWDAVVERRGKFLVFETKDGEVPIKLGQKITLENAIMTAPPFQYQVVILRAKSKDLIKGWDWWLKNKQGNLKQIHKEGGGDDLIKYCRRWFVWASEWKAEPKKVWTAAEAIAAGDDVVADYVMGKI